MQQKHFCMNCKWFGGGEMCYCNHPSNLIYCAEKSNVFRASRTVLVGRYETCEEKNKDCKCRSYNRSLWCLILGEV